MEEQAVMEAIRSLRDHMGLGQVEFADKLGVAYPSVQRYERVRPPTDHERLIALAVLAKSVGRPDLEDQFVQAVVEDLPSQLMDYVRARTKRRQSIDNDPVPDEFAADFRILLAVALASKADECARTVWDVILLIARNQRKNTR